MDIFDKLGALIDGILDDNDRWEQQRRTDSDYDQAWEELDAYLRDEEEAGRPSFEQPAASGIPSYLRKDFGNLEVPPGTRLPEVQKAYKRLMATFHPDRHASNPEKLETATRVSQKINESYQRIRTYYEGANPNAS